MINGCVAKNEFEAKSLRKVEVASKLQKIKPIWGKVSSLSIKKKSSKKEDCVDCYATPMDYVKPPSVSNKTLIKPVKKTYKEKKEQNLPDIKHYGAYDYTETASDTIVKRTNYATSNTYVSPVVSYVNSSYGKYTANVNAAIQVGAFRQYDGAKIYMKRYNALSSKYKVAIKTATNNNKPLHRVRIEGFRTKAEANKFIYSYGIRDAFVVIK
jgi:hypothetical protein